MKQKQGVCGIDHIHGWIGCQSKPSCYDNDDELFLLSDFEEDEE